MQKHNRYNPFIVTFTDFKVTKIFYLTDNYRNFFSTFF